MRLRAYALLLLPLLFAVTACSKSQTSEDRLRSLLTQAEEAAEKKEIGKLRGFISTRYSDDEGRDQRTIDGILRIYLLRHGTVHLLTRIERIEFPQPTQADVVMHVAMAGRPLASAAELASFSADLYRLELRFGEEDGEWRVQRAAWRRAELSDFTH
jgi:hypothetical protein